MTNPVSSHAQWYSLESRRIVITGGAGFLGRQHADAVLAAGGIPVLLDLGAEGLTQAADELEAKFGRRPMTVVCDVTNESGVDAAFDEVMRVQGEIHGVVNNAAYNGRAEFGSAYFSPIDDYPIDAWRKTVDINLTGVFIVTKHALRRMVPQRRGVLVTIASDVGVISPDPRIYEELPPDRYFNTPPSYSATKAAVINLTRHVATHYAKFGIRANALSPAGMFNNQAPEFMAKLTNLIPLGRMARPGEHEATIVFLLSDASSFITGANLMADGGRTAW